MTEDPEFDRGEGEGRSGAGEARLYQVDREPEGESETSRLSSRSMEHTRRTRAAWRWILTCGDPNGNRYAGAETSFQPVKRPWRAGQSRGSRLHQPSEQRRGEMEARGDSKTAAAELLKASDEDVARVDALNRAAAAMRREGEVVPSFFEGFALQGIRVDAIRPGRILCSFTVPARLTTANHQLAPGAVVSLVDEIGSAVSVADGQHLKVSVDMSVSFVDLAAAASGDTLRITATALGHKGYYSGTHVLIANAVTGQVVAEGRHSLFGKLKAAAPSTIIKSNI